jgi:hypothetical protein
MKFSITDLSAYTLSGREECGARTPEFLLAVDRWLRKRKNRKKRWAVQGHHCGRCGEEDIEPRSQQIWDFCRVCFDREGGARSNVAVDWNSIIRRSRTLPLLRMGPTARGDREGRRGATPRFSWHDSWRWKKWNAEKVRIKWLISAHVARVGEALGKTNDRCDEIHVA